MSPTFIGTIVGLRFSVRPACLLDLLSLICDMINLGSNALSLFDTIRCRRNRFAGVTSRLCCRASDLSNLVPGVNRADSRQLPPLVLNDGIAELCALCLWSLGRHRQ